MQLASKHRRFLALVAVAALALGACGGGDDDDRAATTTAATVDDATTTTEGGGEAETVEVGETVWYGGFSVEIAEVTVPPEGEAGTVEVAVTYENQSADAAAFDGTGVLLTSDDTDYEFDLLATELPQVPGERTADDVWYFDVDDTFTLDDAVFTIGGADVNQAVVPLGDEGELVTLEPVELDVSGEAVAGVLDVVVTSGVVRADIPETHAQVDEGRLALYLTFDLTYTASDPAYTGGYAFAHANLALELPDGTTVTPLDGPIELLDSGGTLRDQVAVFEIDNPPPGSYQLVVIDNVGELVEGSFTFEIPDDVEVGTPPED